MHASSPPVRVMVVDDSVIVRGIISREIKKDPRIEVVATASNGEIALRELERHPVDVIILDIEMPVMDGLTALPKLLARKPNVKVLMASTLTTPNAEATFKALWLGAADFIPKPSSRGDVNGAEDFHRELTRKVLGLAPGPEIMAASQPVPDIPSSSPDLPPAPIPDIPPAAPPLPTSSKAARTMRALAIGSSTGGPQALISLFTALKGQPLSCPILITQHMPKTFTTVLARHLGEASGFPSCEGEEGMAVKAGQIYVAPGDYHMEVQSAPGGPVLRIRQSPPENFCRPSVDPMLRSMVACYGTDMMMVMLTGMGADGLSSCRLLKEKGGMLVAQDKATSVVWGMPGAVTEAGLSDAVLPLGDIPAKILHYCRGGGHAR